MLVTTLVNVFLTNLFCSFFHCHYPRYENPVLLPLNSSPNWGRDRAGRNFKFKTVSPIVNSTQGQLEGYIMGALGRNIFAFEGIPYAEAPVGKLRFSAPVPKRPWKGVRKAFKESVECLQFRFSRSNRVQGEEDCLQLNVYTPEIFSARAKGSKFPVMIFIHGGAFIEGIAADFGPAYILQEDIVLVTISYRVGVLGFLSTGDADGLGNWALKDQALAIKWVYDNIANFGGDPSKITLSGQSAGAACVHLHMLSRTNVAVDLFRNAISLSGTASDFWALKTSKNARKLTHEFASQFGCSTQEGSKKLLNCLRRIEPHFLVAGQINLLEFGPFPVFTFVPVIEANVSGAFITESAEDAYANGNIAKIPYMCTTTAHESEYFLMAFKNAFLFGHILRSWERRAPLLLDIKNVKDSCQVAVRIRDYYLRHVPVGQRRSLEQSNIRKYGEIFSDRYFTIGNRKALKLHGAVAPTYSYIFNFTSRFGIAELLYSDYREWGSPHAEDLTMLGNNTKLPPMSTKDKEYKMSRLMISLIANFVTYNIPYNKAKDGSLVETWKPIGDPDYPNILYISHTGMRMIKDPAHGREELKIWKRLGIQ